MTILPRFQNLSKIVLGKQLWGKHWLFEICMKIVKCKDTDVQYCPLKTLSTGTLLPASTLHPSSLSPCLCSQVQYKLTFSFIFLTSWTRGSIWSPGGGCSYAKPSEPKSKVTNWQHTMEQNCVDLEAASVLLQHPQSLVLHAGLLLFIKVMSTEASVQPALVNYRWTDATGKRLCIFTSFMSLLSSRHMNTQAWYVFLKANTVIFFHHDATRNLCTESHTKDIVCGGLAAT